MVRGRALADKATLDASRSIHDNLDQAQQAVAIAREINDQALLARALTACGAISSYSADAARPYLAEAIGIARELGDQWRLTQILTWQAYGAFFAGDPIAAHEASQEGRDLAEAIGDQFHARSCRWTLGLAQMMKGDLPHAITQFRAVTADADAAHDVLFSWGSRLALCNALAFRGETQVRPGPRPTRRWRPPPICGRTTKVSAMRYWPPRRWPRAMSRRRPKRARRPSSG